MSPSPNNANDESGVVIARIIKPHGVRGEVACVIETDFPERFAALSPVRLRTRSGAILNLVIEDRRFVNNRVLLKFKGYDTMDAARGLAGASLVIDESDRKTLEPDEFYEYDLVGLQAVTTGGRLLGLVAKVMPTGAAPLLVVENETGQELLIPFTSAICPEVNVNSRRITVDPPDGLLELNIKSNGA